MDDRPEGVDRSVLFCLCLFVDRIDGVPYPEAEARRLSGDHLRAFFFNTDKIEDCLHDLVDRHIRRIDKYGVIGLPERGVLTVHIPLVPDPDVFLDLFKIRLLQGYAFSRLLRL